MYIALASLGMLFLASLVAYFVTRAQSEVWRTTELPHLPLGLAGSTAILLLQAASLHYAERRLAKNDFDGLRRALGWALGTALFFLIAQGFNWRSVALETMAAPVQSLYAFTFYMLTVLHALHVLGGLVPLGIVMTRAGRNEYSSSRSEGVKLLRQYWDFLLVVWLVLLGSLLLFG